MFPFDLANLGASFKRYFEIVPALTPALRDHAYRIRHQVYCEDLKYEPARPDGREWDEYDAQSLHLLIRSLASGDYIGCTRLILCRKDDPHRPLPFERACAATLDRGRYNPQTMPRQRIAEVSRLAVVRQYRLRRGEHALPAPTLTEAGFGAKLGSMLRPRFPYIPVGLYIGTTELAALHGIDHMFVLTEPRLASQFARLGVHVQKVGAPIEHRGMRVPSMLDVQEILGGISFIMRPLHRVIASQVRAGVEAQQEEQVLDRPAVLAG